MATHKRPLRGWEGEVRVSKTEEDLISADSLHVETSPFTIDTSMDNMYIIGQRSPYAVLEGATSVSGTLTAPFEDSSLSTLAGINPEGPMTIPETPYVLGIFPGGYGEGKDVFIISGVRFGTWSTSIAPDDVVDQSLDWTGETTEHKQCGNIGKKSFYKAIMEGNVDG